jgi:hypothetical protein
VSDLGFLVVLLGVVLAGLAVEAWSHRRRLAAIPLRVHVNGTRGKSTVVRLVAAGLRAGGRRVVAKVTGDAPVLIGVDGREAPIARRGRARLSEQLAVVRTAARAGADALVIENMAIHPELQRVAERRIVRSTVAIVTNVRPDHGEVFGDSREAMAEAFARALPPGRPVLTGEPPDGLGPLPAALERSVPPWMVPDNVALALAACAVAGVPAEVAARGIVDWLASHPEPPVFRVADQIRLVSAFSANDVVSAERLVGRLEAAGLLVPPVAVVLNGRPDRPTRAVAFGRFVARRFPAAPVVLIGRLGRLGRRVAIRAGKRADEVICLAGAPPAVVVARLRALLPDGGSVIGLGNLGGAGRRLLAWLAEREGERR